MAVISSSGGEESAHLQIYICEVIRIVDRHDTKAGNAAEMIRAVTLYVNDHNRPGRRLWNKAIGEKVWSGVAKHIGQLENMRLSLREEIQLMDAMRIG